MPVFDFSGASDKQTGVQSECTYTTFQSNEKETSPEKPIMILDNSSRQWKHHSCGIFTNPIKRTSFEFKEDLSNVEFIETEVVIKDGNTNEPEKQVKQKHTKTSVLSRFGGKKHNEKD